MHALTVNFNIESITIAMWVLATAINIRTIRRSAKWRRETDAFLKELSPEYAGRPPSKFTLWVTRRRLRRHIRELTRGTPDGDD